MNANLSDIKPFLIIKPENEPMNIARKESIDIIDNMTDSVVICCTDNPIAAGIALSDIVSVCMAAKYLGLGYIAVNDDGQAYAFTEKPEKKNGRWMTDSQTNLPLKTQSFKELRKPVSVNNLLMGFTSDSN